MEQHGKNPLQNVIAIIPARYASTRLPGKLLLDIAGKPLILHTLEQAAKARTVSRVIVATDDQRIFDVVASAGGEAVMTSADHHSGSDRVAEVAENLPEGSIIVNVQGDEPMISPNTIDRAVEGLRRRTSGMTSASSDLGETSVSSVEPLGRVVESRNADGEHFISTTCERIEDVRDVFSPDVVKVVTDQNGYALYFSRSPVPYPREAVKKFGNLEKALNNEPELMSIFRKHTGLYVYRREYLLRFTKMPQSKLEKIEMLEQLRALENGAKIKVVEAAAKSISVDTAEDFELVRKILENRKSQI